MDEALACFLKVLRAEPQHAQALIGAGFVLHGQGQLLAAIRCYEEALRLDPKLAITWNNLASVLRDAGRRDEAIDCSRRAIELAPDFAEAHSTLAVSLQYLGRTGEALAHHRRAMALKPSDASLHSNVLYLLNYLPGVEPAAIFAEHRAWGQRHADPLTRAAAPHPNERSPRRRLKVGYVSPHFREHAVNFFVEPILAAHDHEQFEVFCYSDVVRPDQATARLRGLADQWRDVSSISDEHLAEVVRRDQIDILVDLTGHIGGGQRMLTFARKPAPVQVTYIGYQNTTGMAAMDYRLTDAYADPPGMTDAWHTEQLVRLPRTFFCYRPDPDAPPVGALPAETNGFITFGAFNNFTKVTPAVLETWATILRRVEGSRLLLRADMTASLERTIVDTMARHGVDRQRIELASRLASREFRELISRADIALDPFPFNGHTTTCDCLWQGAPVVTLSGRTYVERFGGSGLATLGLDELIAHSVEQYIDVAVELASDRARLANLRGTLRERMAVSPLMDFQGFTRDLEIEYRRIWQSWCQSPQKGAISATNPKATITHHERGHALLLAGRAAEALPEFRAALEFDPHFVRAHFGAGTALLMLQRFEEAIAHYEEVVRLMPRHAEAYGNMAVAWSELRRHDEAIECCRRAIAIQPNYPLAHDNLAGSLQLVGRLDEAIEHHRRAVEQEPTSTMLHSNLLYALNYHPGYDSASLAAEHRAWAARHADPLTAASRPHANDPAPDRPLRVGYVSPHFKQHAVNFFVEPLLAAHDRSRFETYCYSDVACEDETTARLRNHAVAWREIVGRGDEEVAELIRRDRIDVLVDLTGHIAGGSRLPMFARKPAPVQVTYIGYQNTTGMKAMDYRLTDAYADPPGTTDAFYSERLVRLPTTFFCYQPSADAPAVAPLPARERGFVTFLSANHFAKVTPGVLAAWARILNVVERSRLCVLADMTDGLRRHLRQSFAAAGVDPARLDLVQFLPRHKYLELIGSTDVALDPFPFNGHTTTCDCLWQGVSVVTLSGDDYRSRFGGSGLATLGLQELIATSVDDYVERAVALAGDLDRLAALRGSLRDRMAASPLLDFATFARDVETAYRQMWAEWCNRRST